MPEVVVELARPDLLALLETLSDTELDHLPFGVIGFDRDDRVRRYNAVESSATGMAPDRVIGHALFTQVAQCMNNYLVAQRFEDATQSGEGLDATIDFMLTWRMRPTPVRLRMLQAPGTATRYVLLHRLA